MAFWQENDRRKASLDSLPPFFVSQREDKKARWWFQLGLSLFSIRGNASLCRICYSLFVSGLRWSSMSFEFQVGTEEWHSMFSNSTLHGFYSLFTNPISLSVSVRIVNGRLYVFKVFFFFGPSLNLDFSFWLLLLDPPRFKMCRYAES